MVLEPTSLDTEAARFAFLSETSLLLSSALSPDELLRRLGEALVPRLADWYAIDVVSATGATERLAIAHVDPEKVNWAYDLHQRYPTRADAPMGVPSVLRTGKSELYPTITDELLARSAFDDAHLRLLRSVGFTSAMIVPLQAGGYTTGAITLVTAESGRIYTEPDLALGEFLGRQAGLALMNARLHVDRAQLLSAAREAEQQFRTLAESLPQLVWRSRADGTRDYFNQRWVAYTGMPAGMGYDHDLYRYVHPDDLARNLALWEQSVRDGTAHQDEVRLRGADGSYRWFLVWAMPRRNAAGVPIQWFGTCTDIDDQKRTTRIAEEANRAKDEFLAVVSHELRTPLNAILGWSKLLLAEGLSPHQTKKALATIERNARAQAQLVNDILDVSRIITGKLRTAVSPVSLQQVIEAALEVVRPAADSKGVLLHQDLDEHVPPLMGDADRLQQIMWNLLANAVKFTPRGESVSVRLEQIDDACVITVQDRGQGIEAAFLPHLFERFLQASVGTTREHGGLGLGLAIVKHLAELHGGTVQAFSEGLGKGATFVLRLPTAPPRGSDPLLATATSISMVPLPPRNPDLVFPPSLADVRILIVDDEPDARELLASLLERAKAVVWSAPDVATAIDLLRAQRPDLVISDIGMPGEDGYGLIARVRALPEAEGGRTPVVALTAFARAEDRARALREGFDAHLVKPVEPAELLATVLRLTGSAPQSGA